jgi:SAM-dependent methyltransferase
MSFHYSALKAPLRVVIRLLISLKPVRLLGKRLIDANPFLRAQRSHVEEAKFSKICHSLFREKTVLNGPFKGLFYPEIRASGSAIYPKLCGTYEDELHPVVESILGKPYRRILDIGCAEGYYLVGLGKLLRDADLIGVDTDNEARDRCRAMADLNGIEPDRLQLWETMEPFRWPATLVEKTLIICDCEGYEDELFDTEIDIFGKTDLIIECHDFIKPGITAILADRFARTHETQLIRSSSTEEKVSRLKLDSVYLNQLEGREKQALVSEGRPGTMNWLWLVAVSR